jgi:curved DNA-binding protein CbpA
VTQPLDFDPFELLGVDASADAATIDRAYKARIRYVHPDIAGPSGLAESKRLNVAREWLLDPALRESLPKQGRSWHRWRQRSTDGPGGPAAAPGEGRADGWTWGSGARGTSGTAGATSPDGQADASWGTEPPPPWRSSSTGWERRPRQRPAWDYDPWLDDAVAFDYGPATPRLQAFFDAIRSLTTDERARVTYSLGDEPPVWFGDFRDVVGPELWGGSRALADAIDRVWRERDDEGPPLLFPRGRVFGNGAIVAEARAQWMLLGDAIRRGLGDTDAAEAIGDRCRWPWEASLGQPRYGPYEAAVLAFLDEARSLPSIRAERLARAWERDMGSYLYGRPGEDWFPGSLDTPKPELVSARLAAVDASRIEPPVGLAWEHHNGFRFGLRLTAHVLAIGGVSQPGRDYLRPWRAAFDAEPSFMDRARWGLPRG